MGEAEEANGRVTVAVLGERLAHLTGLVEKIDKKLDAGIEAISDNRDGITRADERHTALRRDVDLLSKRSNALDALVALGAAAAALFGLQR